MLFRGNRADHSPCILLRRCFKLAMFSGQHLYDVVHDFTAFFDVGHFASAEHHSYLHLVFMFQETQSLFDFEINIVLSGFRPKSDFFRLGLMRLVLISLLALFVFVFAKVHYAANRRAFVGCNLYQIESIISGLIDSIFGCDDS